MYWLIVGQLVRLRLFQKNNYPSPAPPRIQGGAILRTSKFSPRIRGELEGGKIKPVSFSTKASGIVKYLEKPKSSIKGMPINRQFYGEQKTNPPKAFPEK